MRKQIILSIIRNFVTHFPASRASVSNADSICRLLAALPGLVRVLPNLRRVGLLRVHPPPHVHLCR